MTYYRILLSILIMAAVTYLPRMLPLAIFRKKIDNLFLQSFLIYVPYAVLAAMTFPDILSATSSSVSAVVGLLVAIFLSVLKKGLLFVALGATMAVFITEQVFH